ncbi:MAG: PEFG-CTERM sorting domain-containing protein [Nitrosopumilus sp.]|nr:PEFG-CTERM sorting domain-containing protein [Nitrosopumilus sp.]
MRYIFVLKPVFIGISIIALSIIPNVFAEHVLDVNAFAQFPDISQLSAEKFTLEINNTSFDLYYGYRGSLDSVSKPGESAPVLSLMSINQERKSLEITMSGVPEKNEFWVRIPFKVIYAENENYKVLVDGVDTKYDLMKFPSDYVVGVLIPQNTKNIEIIGTKVIPEFGLVPVLILGISILSVITLRKINLDLNSRCM